MSLPQLLSKEVAEAIVREFAEYHGAKGVVRKLGNFRESHLANARTAFADQMGDDETPLVFIDRSFLSNGKAGLLVTNRGVYSSQLPHVIWLKDIHVVTYAIPSSSDILMLYSPLGQLYFLMRGPRHFGAQLLVNGMRVYASGRPLTGLFWIDLLLALGTVARESPVPPPEAEAEAVDRSKFMTREPPRQASDQYTPAHAGEGPRVVVLEVSLSPADGQPFEVRRVADPSIPEIERAITDLDPSRNSTLRLSVGDVGKEAILDILGGNGKYALRQPVGGWVFYDPSQGDEEVEVCTGKGGRFPAYYVCTDLQRVLQIASHFVETGAFE